MLTAQTAGTARQEICDGGHCVSSTDRNRFAEIKPADTLSSATPSPAPPRGLPALAGSYGRVSGLGKTANCDKNAFRLSFNGDEITFTELNGKQHVEKILKFDNDQLSTQVISSPDERSGTLYIYRTLDDGSLSVRNLRNNNNFTLGRCTNSTAQNSPAIENSGVLARQQASVQDSDQQAARRLQEPDVQKQAQVAERKRPSGVSTPAVTQCDRLAASPLDSGRLAPGVEVTKPAAPAAILLSLEPPLHFHLTLTPSIAF